MLPGPVVAADSPDDTDSEPVEPDEVGGLSDTPDICRGA